jgi:4-amino-4-deoxy-L-arabinose transferase
MNQAFGIFTVLVSALSYMYAWNLKSKQQFSSALLLLMLSGLILRVFTSCDFFLHNWDEQFHALVAKNLIKHPLLPTLYDKPILLADYKSWTASHIWLHKQPLTLWVMSLSLSVFGINELALRLPSIILSTMAIALTFSIAKYFYNEQVGFLAAFFFSVNGLIIEMTAGRIPTDHVDVFFLFFVELSVFFSVRLVQKKQLIYSVFVGMSIGAAILCKWLPALIVIPVCFLLMKESNKFSAKEILLNLTLTIFTIVVIILPWQIYIISKFPLESSWEMAHNYRHITEVLDKQGGPFYYYLDKIRINYGELIYLPLIWFLWKVIMNPKDYKTIALLLWFLVPFIFFSVIKTKMQGYILFISPVLFILSAAFIHFLKKEYNDGKHKWITGILLMLLIGLPIRYSFERVKPFSNAERCPNYVQKLKALNLQNLQNGVLFNYDKPVEAMFYTDLTAYESLPDKSTIDDLINSGVTVLIKKDIKVPPKLYSVKGIIWID